MLGFALALVGISEVLVEATACVTLKVSVYIGMPRIPDLHVFVLAGRLAPVMCFIKAPFSNVGMLVVIIPGAFITDYILVAINVSAYLNVIKLVSADGSEPMRFLIVKPFVNVLVCKVEKTLVANSVCIFVRMRNASFCFAKRS